MQGYSVGQIADALGVREYRVMYVLRRDNIRPIGRYGVRRLFDQEAVEHIERELLAIDSRRRQRPQAVSTRPQILADGGGDRAS
jgi:hypothetical protein